MGSHLPGVIIAMYGFEYQFFVDPDLEKAEIKTHIQMEEYVRKIQSEMGRIIYFIEIPES